MLINGLNNLAITNAAGALMACTCLVVVYSWIKRNCTCLRKADVRKIPGVGPCFIRSGIDKYEKFSMIAQIHSAKDLPKTSVLGNPKLYVTIQARYETVKSRITSTAKWEQAMNVVIPQGTTELYITLWEQKTLGSDAEIGYFELEVEGNLKGNPGYFGKKKTFKLTKEDAAGQFGQLTITFRSGGDSGSVQEPILKDFDADSKPALYGVLLDLLGEMDEDKMPRNLEGVEKLELLAKVLQGKLTSSKSKGAVFCAVVELFPTSGSDGDDSGGEVDVAKLSAKAKKKGLGYIPKKWYWATYLSKKEFQKNPDKPDSRIPILSISSVHVDPQNPGDLYIRYFNKGAKKSKDEIKYKCEDTDVEAWSDALELFREECRALKFKQQKREEDWAQLSLDDKFKEWMEFYKKQGYTDEELKQYYEQYTISQLPPDQRRVYLDQKTKKEYYKSKQPAGASTSSNQ